MQSFNAKRSRKIQTTALGYSDDFDLQVKLGLLLGERLVLWDTVIRSILSKPDSLVDLDELGKTVNGLLLLRPIAETGDLVLLPQPKTWLDRANRYYRLMPDEARTSNTFKGYLNANALLEEGFILHPYLMQNEHEYQRTINSSFVINSSYYSKEKADYHSSLLRVLKNKKLSFFDKVNASEFYKTIKNIDHGALNQLKRKLAEKLSFPNCGMSPEEKEQWIDGVEAELESFAPNVNRCITSIRLDSGFAGIGALSATFGVVNSAASAGAFAAIFSGLGAIGSIGTFIQKIFRPPKDPILYQVFSQLNQAAQTQTIKIIQDEMDIPGRPQ